MSCGSCLARAVLPAPAGGILMHLQRRGARPLASHVHTHSSAWPSALFCTPSTPALQVVEVSARYDDSCVAGSNNRDRESTLLQVSAKTPAAHMRSCLQLPQQKCSVLKWRQIGSLSACWCHSLTALMHGHLLCTASALSCSGCCVAAVSHASAPSDWQKCSDLHRHGPQMLAPCSSAGVGWCHDLTLRHAWPSSAHWRCTVMLHHSSARYTSAPPSPTGCRLQTGSMNDLHYAFITITPPPPPPPPGAWYSLNWLARTIPPAQW